MTRKRKNARVDCAIEGKLIGRRTRHKGTVHNLSTGGLFFAGKSLDVGERTELEFGIGEKQIHATCEVLYRQSHGEGAGIGVRFLRLSPGAEALIRGYLAEGDSASRKGA